MKKLVFILIVISFLPTVCTAQLWKLKRYEITGAIGTTQLFGDIGGYSNEENILGIKDFSFNNLRFNVSVSARYRILENVSARINLSSGVFHSSDLKGSNPERGFESNTVFFEPTLTGEYYFIKNKTEKSFNFMKRNRNPIQSFLASLDVYVFTGFGGISYKVTPNDKLAPSASETSGFAAIVPLGIGVIMIYSNKINFGIEWSGRITFTDNLDGYAPPESKANDVYHMLNFTVTYKIKTGKNGLPAF
jgi:hypothetical protein